MRGFVEVRDCNGCRHVLRASSVLAISEIAEDGRTAISMPGNRTLVLDEDLDRVAGLLEEGGYHS